MGRYTERKDLYNQPPLFSADNRDENILIDILGNWIPECDIIYYGLLNSHYSEELYKLKTTSMFNIHDIYLDTSYFTGDDLIRYLASTDDTLAELSDEYIRNAIVTAIDKYYYVPCNETMLRHAIIELAYSNFVKSITLLYPWDIREIDYQYLKHIIPLSVLEKFKIVSGTMLGFLESKANSGTKYTTIISNSTEDINTMIDECDKYHTNESFFLLRNHSGNVKHEILEDPETPGKKIINFEELENVNIIGKLMDMELGIPKTKMRFARYEPNLFEDTQPDPENFKVGR